MKYFAGLDVSLRETSVCIINADGDLIREAKVLSEPEALGTYLKGSGFVFERLGLEAGQLSSWLHQGLANQGLPAVCVESRHMSTALKAQRIKTDRNDARGIAHMMRTGWFKPVHVKSLQSQKLRALLTNRRWLIQKRTDITNQIRGTVRAFGFKVGQVSMDQFEGRIRDLLSGEADLLAIIEPMFRMRDSTCKEIVVLDRLVREAVKADDVCRRLMTVPGIGPINAIAFKTAIDNPHNFKKSGSVGAFFGLTPSKYASGDIDYNGPITKCGDPMVREYLFEAAQSLMARVKKPNAMKAWAARIAKRSSKKKAIVALARKLSIVMHRLWVDGTTYRHA